MPSYTKYNDDRHSAGIPRHCSRCFKELTDAASREHGVGPICRKKTNALHAVQIPANLNVASALFLSLRESDFAEQVEDFSANKDEFVRIMERIARRNDNLTAITLTGGDFRNVVNWFDYALSFKNAEGVRGKVIEIIEALGYVGLASVLRGDACMSPATLLVEGNAIKLSGKACTAGYWAMRNNIPGVTTPRSRGDRSPYVASVRHAEKFVELALRHWPFIDADPAEVLADAAMAAEKLGDSASDTPECARPVATIRKAANRFTVTTPWTGTREEMTAMLNRFKELPRRERSYDPGARAWAFKLTHLETVKAIVAERYNIEVNTVS